MSDTVRQEDLVGCPSKPSALNVLKGGREFARLSSRCFECKGLKKGVQFSGALPCSPLLPLAQSIEGGGTVSEFRHFSRHRRKGDASLLASLVDALNAKD